MNRDLLKKPNKNCVVYVTSVVQLPPPVVFSCFFIAIRELWSKTNFLLVASFSKFCAVVRYRKELRYYSPLIRANI